MAPRIREVVPPVGSRVTLKFGGRDVVATVIEDRGPLAGDGRRLLRVRVPLTDTDPIEFEIPAAKVRVAARSPSASCAVSRASVCSLRCDHSATRSGVRSRSFTSPSGRRCGSAEPSTWRRTARS